MPAYQRVGVVTKPGLPHRDEALHLVERILRVSGAEIAPQDAAEDDIDLLLVLGGDGTILKAVRSFRTFAVPVLSVNRGTVGFLTEAALDEAEKLLPRLLRGEGAIDERAVLRVQALRGGTVVAEGHALNEAVVAQGSIARIVDLRTAVDGETLTTFNADGLIIATPTGSTAYNLAAGGPVVHPSLPATILTPINPHQFSQKPIVLCGNSSIEVEVLARRSPAGVAAVVLALDGQVSVPLESGDRIVARLDVRTVKFLRRKESHFFGMLREKLFRHAT